MDTQILLIIIALVFIFPLYLMILYFLFHFLKNKFILSPSETFERRVVNMIHHHNKRISKIEEHSLDTLDNFKERLDNNDKIIKGKLDEHGAQVQLYQLKIQEMMTKMEFAKFRNSISLSNMENKINEVIKRIIDNYIQYAYTNNPRYMASDGSYILPNIDKQRRESDLQALYARFMNDISQDLIEEINLVYNLNEAKTEAFMISNYIAPYYNDCIRSIKKEYKEAYEENAKIEKAMLDERNKNSTGTVDERVERLRREVMAAVIK